MDRLLAYDFPFKHFFLIYLHAVINLYDHLSGLSERSFGAPNLEKKTVKYARLFICLLIYIRVPFIYSISLVSPVGLRGGGVVIGFMIGQRLLFFLFISLSSTYSWHCQVSMKGKVKSPRLGCTYVCRPVKIRPSALSYPSCEFVIS